MNFKVLIKFQVLPNSILSSLHNIFLGALLLFFFFLVNKNDSNFPSCSAVQNSSATQEVRERQFSPWLNWDWDWDWRPREQRSPARCSPQGHRDSDMTAATWHTHTYEKDLSYSCVIKTITKKQLSVSNFDVASCPFLQ